MTTTRVHTWAWHTAVTQDARDGLPQLDAVLAKRARETVPNGWTILSQDAEWSASMLPGWTDDETGEWVRGPEWMYLARFRVIVTGDKP
jgi:hypothetical protein